MYEVGLDVIGCEGTVREEPEEEGSLGLVTVRRVLKEEFKSYFP